MAKNYTTLTRKGITYVLNDADNRGCYIRTNYVGGVTTRENTKERIPMPNFLGTGMALKAILRKNETLDGWRKRTGNR